MTDWLRVLGYGFLGVLITLGVGWESWVLYHRRKFRMTEQQQADITASRVGWYETTKKEPRK